MEKIIIRLVGSFNLLSGIILYPFAIFSLLCKFVKEMFITKSMTYEENVDTLNDHIIILNAALYDAIDLILTADLDEYVNRADGLMEELES